MTHNQVVYMVRQIAPEQRAHLEEQIRLRAGVARLTGRRYQTNLAYSALSAVNGQAVLVRQPCRNSKVTTCKVTPEEMEKLWR